jgi:two-component system C4-dicarboxylate transport sensor histidine kinase DctB
MASSNWTDTGAVTRRWAWGLAGVVLAALAWQLGSVQRTVLLDDLVAQGRQQLDLYVSHLAGQLNRYAFLPALLADDFRLQSLLIAPANEAQQQRVNRLLEHVNAIAGSLDVYLMDGQGITVAASNWRRELTFIGRDFSFRPYFSEAMAGRPGRYYALGTTSGRRGYYFSHPVGDLDEPLGVVVVKVDIDTLESAWRGRDSELLVTDPDGVIFVSTRPDWRYRSLTPLPADDIARIRESRRYTDAPLTPVFAASDALPADDTVALRVAGSGGTSFLRVERAMPEVGWHVQLLIPSGRVQPQVWQTRLFALTFLVLLVLIGWSYLQRRKRQREREQERRQAMQEALVELEERVGQRTRDLTEANRLLREEARQHEQTRDELIQAAKLAALGQMSAGINHELNQPLAAMRTYADNARAYLERQQLERVAWNLQQIIELTGRMSQISGQLKVFSRKSSGRRSRVSVVACLEGAKRILRTRLQQADVQLVVRLDAPDFYVAADMVQLEQVLVNLVGNACDVLLGRPQRRVEVSAERRDDRVWIHIRDTGPGIDAAHIERVFDPFFTTSDAGLGLGLSISHTIAQRLGGDLRAANGAAGGAEFTLVLPAWDAAADATAPQAVEGPALLSPRRSSASGQNS